MTFKTPKISSSEITSQAVYKNRRDFLKLSAFSLLPLATTNTFANNKWQESSLIYTKGDNKWDARDKLTQYKHASTYNNFYEFGTKKSEPHKHAPHLLKTSPWNVTVSGACEKPGVYALEDILKLVTLEERIYRLRCVEAWSMVIPWIGFELNKILKAFQPLSNAKFVAFETLHDVQQMPAQQVPFIDWPYVEGLRMDEAMHPLTIMAVGMYGDVLPNQSGAPLRLVVPWKYGFKSIKSIVKTHFTETMPPNTWNLLADNEYGFYANVNPEVDHPRWSQKKERRIGTYGKRKTLMFNGYAQEVAHLYTGMDLRKYY